MKYKYCIMISIHNVLLTDAMTESPSVDNYIQIVLIDFGKATSVNNNRKYTLSGAEKAKYTRKYPYIAPDGLTTQTISSDVYSVGHTSFV